MRNTVWVVPAVAVPLAGAPIITPREGTAWLGTILPVTLQGPGVNIHLAGKRGARNLSDATSISGTYKGKMQSSAREALSPSTVL